MKQKDITCKDLGGEHVRKRRQQDQSLWDGIKIKFLMDRTKAFVPEVNGVENCRRWEEGVRQGPQDLWPHSSQKETWILF